MQNRNLLFNNFSEDSMWIKQRNDKKFLDKFCESKCGSVLANQQIFYSHRHSCSTYWLAALLFLSTSPPNKALEIQGTLQLS